MTSPPREAWIGIFAHPDDEWAAGWPVFQRADALLGVIFFVGDNRPGRQFSDPTWRPRVEPVLRDLGITLLGCLDLTPEFYRSPRQDRRVWRDRLAVLLQEALRTPGFENARLFTHNPTGEYGNPDHIEVNRAVLHVAEQPVFVTDLTDGEPLSARTKRLYYGRPASERIVLDWERWQTARTAYATSLRWTAWDRPGQDSTRLYEL